MFKLCKYSFSQVNAAVISANCMQILVHLNKRFIFWLQLCLTGEGWLMVMRSLIQVKTIVVNRFCIWHIHVHFPGIVFVCCCGCQFGNHDESYQQKQ